MDKFKQYLQQQNWEVDEPSPKAWKAIAQQVQHATPMVQKSAKRGIVVRFFKYALAACVIGLAAIGGWYLMQGNPNQPPNEIAANTLPTIKQSTEKSTTTITATPINSIKPQIVAKQHSAKPNQPTYTPNATSAYKETLINIENSFMQVIYQQKAKINTTPLFGETALYYKDFTDRLNQMDKDEKQIKKDIVQMGFTPQLMEQLINVYQQKLNVLKLLQTEIQKTNNRFKQNRTAADTLQTNFIEI